MNAYNGFTAPTNVNWFVFDEMNMSPAPEQN